MFCEKLLTFFVKHSVLDVWQVSEYPSVTCYSLIGKTKDANHSVHSLSAGGGGGVEPSTKFSKKEVLTGSQFVEEVVGKERCDLFQGGGAGVASFT